MVEVMHYKKNNVMHRKWKNHSGEILSSKDGFDVINCEVCKFNHIVPLPSESELKKLYDESFYEEKDQYIKNHTKDLDWWEIEFNEKFDFLESNITT